MPNLLTARLNTYFAVLMVTIVGSGAALIIIHIGTAKAFGQAADRAAYSAALKY